MRSSISCWFHYTQSVKRNAAEIPNFFKCVRTDKEHLLPIYYKLQCLPLLPEDEIISAFHALKVQLLSEDNETEELTDSDRKRKKEKKEALSKFVNYFERQWIKRVSHK